MSDKRPSETTLFGTLLVAYAVVLAYLIITGITQIQNELEAKVKYTPDISVKEALEGFENGW